jgi:hypothetical protein
VELELEMVPEPNTDPSFSNIVLLLHMDGSNNSTTFTDSSSSARTVTASGTAKLTTTSPQYGSAAGLFDGSGYLRISDGTWCQLNTTCTIETWFNVASLSSTYMAFFSKAAYAQNYSWGLYVNNAGFIFYTNQTNSSFTATATVTTGVWHHVAITYTVGSGVTLWLDGTAISASNSIAITDASADVIIGAADSTYPNSFFVGKLDDFRITKGVARYGATFTPVGPFPDS